MAKCPAICVLLGVPATDVDRFHKWSNTIFADWSGSREKIAGAYAAMSRYMSQLKLLAQQAEVAGQPVLDLRHVVA